MAVSEKRERDPTATPVKVSAVVVVAALTSGLLLTADTEPGNPFRITLTAAAGGLAALEAWMLWARSRSGTREREVWRGWSGSAALASLGLLAEAGLQALVQAGIVDDRHVGSGFVLGALAASALLYRGTLHWNRYKTYLSDPGDWLNGVSAVIVIVAGGGLVLHATDAPMAGWPGIQAEIWLAHMGALLVILGAVVTVASLGGLAQDRRAWMLAAALAGSMTAVVGTGAASDVLRALVVAQVGWLSILTTVVVCSVMTPARLSPRASSSQAPTVGAIVVLLASVSVLALNGIPDSLGQVSTTVLASLAALGSAVRMLGLVRNLSELARSQLEARTDDLTGLPNRRALSAALADSVRKHERAVLLTIDLDRFKQVNDRFGHSVGDDILKTMARRLQAQLPAKGLLARLGGDEFAVLLTGPTASEGLQIARAILGVTTEPVAVGSRRVRIGASIGVAAAGSEGHRDGELMHRADTAMHTAKRVGGGIELYDEVADLRARQERELTDELHQLLGPQGSDRAVEQLVLHYQPQLDVVSGDPVGAEALVRWQHPERGLLYPDAFLELVERHGLMARLTMLVVSRSAAEAAHWHRSGHLVNVAVNLSASSLSDPGLLTMVDRALAESGIDAGYLKLEITETTLMRDPELALQVTRALASRGIGISIDDYGTGYSSLAYLNDLPAEEIKLDRSFTARVVDEPRTAAIVAGTIDLAHHLGLTLLAEGVEDEATLAVLASLGCDHSQGYFHAEPMPADRFRAWLAERASPSTEASAG